MQTPLATAYARELTPWLESLVRVGAEEPPAAAGELEAGAGSGRLRARLQPGARLPGLARHDLGLAAALLAPEGQP